MVAPLNIFCCYARKDRELLEQLLTHLAPLQRQHLITIWSDQDLNAGVEWEKELHARLESADIILLLISPDFMSSDYCYSTEMGRAITRHDQGSAHVVPLLLRPTLWKTAPFAKLQMRPSNARPVTSWLNSDEAFNDIAEGIYQVILQSQSQQSPHVANTPQKPDLSGLAAVVPTIKSLGDEHYNAGRYAEALALYEQAVRLDPNDADAHLRKGMTLDGLGRYGEALAAHGQAIRLDPNFARAHNNKGIVLDDLGRYGEALAAYEQAIRLEPNVARAHNNKGVTLYNLQRYGEALAAYEQAIRLDPNYADAYHNKGVVLDRLGRKSEAQQAYNKAQQLEANN